ncbi:hypothetical protein SBDP1_350012 [Syntrophobacter sp. SbD1]|nr:hypothetical protein SBDP1_350012 [Syntrophobacter sp. SbD1]
MIKNPRIGLFFFFDMGYKARLKRALQVPVLFLLYRTCYNLKLNWCHQWF